MSENVYPRLGIIEPTTPRVVVSKIIYLTDSGRKQRVIEFNSANRAKSGDFKLHRRVC